MSSAEIIQHCQALYDDIEFDSARAWKSAESGRRVIGYMPVYVPRELIHAGGMLPLGILGGGDKLEVIHGDAYYQSYICRIPRSTIELGISKRLDFVDGMLFPKHLRRDPQPLGHVEAHVSRRLRSLLRRAAELCRMTSAATTTSTSSRS